MLPILYKLFSKVILARIGSTLDAKQTVEQAGFRSGFSVDDHLFTIVSVIDRLAEFNLPLWVCTIDYRKAFDTVEFRAIWEALLRQGIPRKYVCTLHHIYDGQIGKIVAEKTSKPFKILRGTKQGDPISPVLFNSVLHEVFDNIAYKWNSRKYGVQVGNRFLSNLRFADDILLLASSRTQLCHMLIDLASASDRVGLQLHQGKTKVMTNIPSAN
eukprot:7042911-Karenia_brevis.AAC.1